MGARVFLIALGATALSFGATKGKLLGALDGLLYDIGIAARPVRVPPDMVILGIDQSFMRGADVALAPRDRLAQLLNNCVAGGARAVALDVWLHSRLDYGPKQGDWQLRRALQNAHSHGVPVVLSGLSAPLWTRETAGQNAKSGVPHRAATRGSVLPFFAEFARVGDVILELDTDDVLRRFVPEDPDSLPAQMNALANSNHSKAGANAQPANLSGADTNRLNAPKSGAARLELQVEPLEFCGPPGTVARQSASDFLQPELAPLLADKVVFIGATYSNPDHPDLHPSPFFQGNTRMPIYGVEFLAQATAALHRREARHLARRAASGDFWTDFWMGFWMNFGDWRWFLVALVALGNAFLSWRNTARGAGALLLSLVGAGAVSILAARGDFNAVWSFEASPFGLASLGASSGALVWRGVLQARELALVRDTFGAYVGAQVLDSLGGKMPELGGENRHIAVLFCDIRGYSALAESIADPRALLDELNAHFEPLVVALQERGAHVDNYVGDLVMALFGAPVSAGSYALDVRAGVLAALDFVRLVEERNIKRREAGQIPIEIGVGLHCGEAVVGNMGARGAGRGGKIHYTAIGDVINVASRIEGATRTEGVALLVTREVVEALSALSAEARAGLPDWNSRGAIAVNGRTAPVEIYALAPLSKRE